MIEILGLIRSSPLKTLALLAFLGGCATSPATGERIFTGFMSPEREQQIGAAEHPKILKQFGGAYNDPKVNAYIQRIGPLLARNSELPNQNFTFTVLNSPELNAFAVPGGYIYITRGLMALAGDEAELAGVVAHEIGHITARHTAQRYSQAQLAGLSLGIGGALASVILGTSAGPLQDIAGVGAQIYLSGFSQEQEFEADSLGVRYLGRTGYKTEAMARFLTKMRAHSQFQAQLSGRSAAKVDAGSLLATHPRTIERVNRAAAQVRPVAQPRDGRFEHMQAINGMLFDADPKQGFVRGREFIHPTLRFRFRVPPDFRLKNRADAVIARDQRGAFMIFDTAPKAHRGSIVDYLTRVWARNNSVNRVERITVNGMEGATGTSQRSLSRKPLDIRLLAVRSSPKRIYRIIFATPRNRTQALSEELRRTTFSLRNISAAEAARFKPRRVFVRAVNPGETVESLAKQMQVDRLPAELFRVLNGLLPNQQPRTGQLIKLVKES